MLITTEQAETINDLIALCRDCEYQCASAHKAVSEKDPRIAIAGIATAWRDSRRALEVTLLYGEGSEEPHAQGTLKGLLERKLNEAQQVLGGESRAVERLLDKHEQAVGEIRETLEDGELAPELRALIKMRVVQLTTAGRSLRSHCPMEADGE